MRILLLSCSTGEGHNHCAEAVRQALQDRGHGTDFLDMLHLFGAQKPVSVESLLNVISTRAPNLFGLMYKAGERVSELGVTSPVYLVNSAYGRKLCDLIDRHGYDAVVCSHLFPMETLTYIRRTYGLKARCYGILSDFTCIPFLAETELDGYFLPHELVRRECLEAGIPAEKLIVTGMPVAPAFRAGMTKVEARAALDIPPEAKLYLIMTGGIGCGDALGLCEKLLALPDRDALLCVLAGRNQELLDRLRETYGNTPAVRPIPFTDQVSVYMRAADVLLSKAGGISSAEAAVAGVPLVHTMMIPGVETRNAEFFSGLGMSLLADGFEEAARFADRIVYDGKTGEALVRAQREHMPQDGADRIAEYIAARSLRREAPAGGYRILRAGGDDAQGLVPLVNVIWPDHDEAALRKTIAGYAESPDTAVFTAEKDGGCVGVALCSLRRDYVEGCSTSPVGYLEGVSVREDLQGQGIGRRLTAACEAWAREKGCTEFASDCELDNAASLAFHRHVGFREANRIICFQKEL